MPSLSDEDTAGELPYGGRRPSTTAASSLLAVAVLSTAVSVVRVCQKARKPRGGAAASGAIDVAVASASPPYAATPSSPWAGLAAAW